MTQELTESTLTMPAGRAENPAEHPATTLPPTGYVCAVEEAARIVGQKWTLQIVNALMDFQSRRFCELQDALGGVNPSTLSARLKMLEEEGLVYRFQVSSVPPHVEYRLTPMGEHLSGAIRELTAWSRTWLCAAPVKRKLPRALPPDPETC
jgi:DNA-binding HxlR family transcriptional regulator